ncbi:cation:proton antiporter [Candidatus Roizmanbacteria bacterium]|nr:MAG: cation:proton antiporter [Candidatus Roizmanbacteria bacterium]
MEIFIEISIIIFVAMIVSIVMRLLKQPLIVGYILTGILIGPYVLNLLHSGEVLELFSKIGITILLFIVGLNLSPNVIKEVGKVSLFTGLGQVLFTSIIGFVISRALGIDTVAAIFVAIALTFSSTIIILKLLSDKGDLNKLYGKIAIGFLLVQDIVATIILLVTTSFAAGSGGNVAVEAVVTLGKGALLITALIAVSNYILPKLSKFIASSQELLFLFSISWGLGMATLFSILGFSVEIGALVAGVTMSMTPYAFEAASRLRPLRDFFILLFFILLGSEMVLDGIGSLLFPAAILSVFVLIGNPIIVVIIMNLLGYSKRTGFQAGLTVAQISEFSLILATLGFQIGSLSKEVLSLITIVGLVTIAGSTYLILYADNIYPKVEKLLSFLELKKNKREKSSDHDYDSLLFGFQRVGQDFVKSFEKLGLRFMIIDFNPDSIKLAEDMEIPCKYGDAKDPEFIEELNIRKLKYVVTTIPEFETNLHLVKRIRSVNKRAIIIAISHNRDEALSLYAEGTSYVIMPHYLGAEYAVRMINKHGLEKGEYQRSREKHLQYLENRII